MEHTVLGPLFVVLIYAVVGFILACVLSDVAEQCGRGEVECVILRADRIENLKDNTDG